MTPERDANLEKVWKSKRNQYPNSYSYQFDHQTKNRSTIDTSRTTNQPSGEIRATFEIGFRFSPDRNPEECRID